MSERSPTLEQATAIEADARSVMVEAGAGTGKTGVMVDRYCRIVCDQGVSPDAVLAFTFTEKAAAELRERIRATIEARAAAGSERARELVPALGGAWVTTIHGFCNRLLAGHPVAAGIDPRFRVLDATEAERVAGEAFERALEEFLAGGDEGRERLVAAYDVAGLRSLAIALHAALRSRGEGEPRLPAQPEPDVAASLRRAAAVAAEALAELKPSNGQRELVERAVEQLDGAETPGLDALATLRTRKGGKALAAYREAIDELVSRAAEAGEGGAAYRDLSALLELFSARFAAAKERRAGLDFEDLQLLAVRLLENETGAFYRERFEHLLVDEFQDTNHLQLRLIETLRGPRTRLMAVGDELQSIYGFRHADLDVFREQRALIEADPDGEVLPLSGNFRSRPEAIGAVNAIGERLLGESYRQLRVGAAPSEPEPPGGGAVELLLTGHEGWDDEGIDLEPATDARTPTRSLAEARQLAARLRELADAGVPRGSMVVLLRAYTHLDAHEDSLERAGLRPYVVGGRGYWSQQQVADVCALLATIANPLDDQALLGALASPACGASPDALWLLRAAAGPRRHLWPALERAVGTGGDEEELEEPGLLDAIPADDRELLGRFVSTLGGLRRRAPLLSLPGLVEAAVGETGYDLAVLMRRAGEARFANVRKLMRMAAEFELAEGRDLRGLLDFLAARAGADADPQAASAVEGHDGVRIMTVHSAKGLEFDVVAIPGLARGLLAAARTPPLAIGHGDAAPRVGMQLRRLGAGAIDLYDYRALCDEEREREATEELRLFHVAATRARERLILSGVVRPKPPSLVAGTSVVERIVAAFDVDRERDSEVAIPAPAPGAGLDASFPASAIQVRVNLASPERAAALRPIRPAPRVGETTEAGPAPLVPPTPPPLPAEPLSYTAIDDRIGGPSLAAAEMSAGELDRERAAARGIAAHALLEWSHANGWAEPPAEAIERIVADAAAQKGIEPATLAAEDALAPLRAWTGSPLFAERVASGAARTRVEVPLLMQLAGRTIRGSIDLLVEEDGRPPLIVDYKTDRLGEAGAAAKAGEYETQRDLYALAVAEATGAGAVEVAYVFLERPEEPAVSKWGPDGLAAARLRLESKIRHTETA